MISKDVWRSLSANEQLEKVAECLIQLDQIENGTHHLIGTRQEGRLSKVRKDLASFIIDTAEWEKTK